MLCCALLLCGCSKKVKLSSGRYDIESTEIAAVVQAEDIALLDSFTMLQTADFSGSTCYEELFNWVLAHPEVDTKYTVSFSNGLAVDNMTANLDLSDMSAAEIEDAVSLLGYLPELESINMGKASDENIVHPEVFTAIRAMFPDIQFEYTLNLLGKELSFDTTSVDLSNIKPTDVTKAAYVLAYMPEIRNINLGTAKLDWEHISSLSEAAPNAIIDYGFSLYGKDFNLKDEELDISYITLDDNAAALRQVLPYMKNCSFVNMDSCGISNEDMAKLRDEFPQMKIVWRIWFGDIYSVRTDTEKILASKPSVGGTLDNTQVEVLKYCTDLKYLDVGHNLSITDLSFINYMPNLEVAILAMNYFEDISPLANCPKLEFLELNSTHVTDLSPLANSKELRHLNIGNCPNLTDISSLYGLTELERFWIGSITAIPDEQVAKMRESAPNCEVNDTTYDPHEEGWRQTGYTELSLMLYAETGWLQPVYHPRYELLQEQLGYPQQDYSFYYNDPLYLGSPG